MAFVNFVVAFVAESLIVDYIVFHKLKSTKFYKNLETRKPRYKEINQQTRNNTDWLKDAVNASVGIVNKGFESASPNNEIQSNEIANTNSNISLISNNNSTVDLISKGYESDLNGQQQQPTPHGNEVLEQSTFTNNLKLKVASNAILSSSPIDNLTFSTAANPKLHSPIDSHINKGTLIQVDVHRV